MIEQWLGYATLAADVAGVVVVLIGFGVGVVGFVSAFVTSRSPSDRYAAVQRARCGLGTYLLFGLELMIVSDVLRSVASHSLEDLGALGLLVVIRTVIAYFLGREIEEIRAGQTPG